MTPNTSTIPMSAWLEDAWLDRYLERRLSPDECAWFETYALERPRLVARIEADNDLRDALHAAAAAVRADGSPQTPPGAELREDGQARARRGAAVPVAGPLATPRIGLAWAASLVLAGVLGAIGGTRFGPGRADLDPIASPPRLVFDTLRGTAVAGVLHAGDTRSPYVLVEVSLPVAAEQAMFVDASGRSWPVQPGVDGFVSVLLPRAALDQTAAPRLRYRIQGREVERWLEADYAALRTR